MNSRRRDAFVSFHSRDKVRGVATKEYYDTAGNIKYMINEDVRKQESDVKK